MSNFRNVYACLVHEKIECVMDLVRNLRHFDPASGILLYNGGKDAGLLDQFPFAEIGVHVHPAPRPMRWGWLHDYALDCMRYAQEHLPFDTLTIVDSDQLAAGKNFSAQLEKLLQKNPNAGMFISTPARQDAQSKIPPVMTMWKEAPLWKNFLEKFPNGEKKFLHWSFWPASVFTAKAARDLVWLFDNDEELAAILGKTKIWASEEVLFPTITALLGYDLVQSPGKQDYVKYRTYYPTGMAQTAFQDEQVFWIHPVQRREKDPFRKRLREVAGNYPLSGAAGFPEFQPDAFAGFEKVQPVEGWLEQEEATLLWQMAHEAMQAKPDLCRLVEVGSWCGRSTVALGLAAKNDPEKARVYAIDPFEGMVGAADDHLVRKQPTWDRFLSNIRAAGVQEVVEPVRALSTEVRWKEPIRFLFIDGLHDYFNVARDFYCFEKHLENGSCVAFHDYADYYPGVIRFVDELVATGNYVPVAKAKTLVVLRKTIEEKNPTHSLPLVSCIMPTCNRRAFVGDAIKNFLEQDYPEKELLILDDGAESVKDLVPHDPRIRYFRQESRMKVGEKRNRLCAAAKGKIILHWDDDDQRTPQWITLLADHLEKNNADVTGLMNVKFFDPRKGEAWEYNYPPRGKHWVHGGTMCYRKALWQKKAFDTIDVGEDARFLWNDVQKKISPANCIDDYLAIIHETNISPKLTGTALWKRIDAGMIPLLEQARINAPAGN